MVNFTINGRPVTAEKGESILQVARREGIYVPTMCYLPKTTPNASCRMCVVEVEGVDGFVLSCNTPPTEGAAISTDSSALYKERQNIMKLYNVNHPLQCGVCDKSGECDLQNKTLEFDVASQEFSVREQVRKKKKWGVLSYDPYLCIMCEKCTAVCNQVVGAEALYIRPGGYKSEIDNNMGRCIQCGECIAVCPVGAMASSDFKYTSNAWELARIPSACAHCSSACNLNYEVKHTSIAEIGAESVYRVTNEYDFDALCIAGRFGYDFDNRGVVKDEAAFGRALAAFREADTLRFNSMITNEEAMLLQRLKERFGYKLINPEARRFNAFMGAFASTGGSSLYGATLDDVRKSDYIVMLGSAVTRDNPMVQFALTVGVNRHKAYVTYMHPIEDRSIQNLVSQYVKYEVGSEEGVMAMLCDRLLGDDVKQAHEACFNELDLGYVSGESSVGEEEIDLMIAKLRRSSAPVIVLGEDLFNHARSENIAKLAGLLERHTAFKVLMVPPSTNTLGVSLICNLDAEAGSHSIGYNVKGDFTLSALGDGDLDMPALNQQEGTFANIDKQVVPLNAAVVYGGYELNDIACALGVVKKHVIDYTPELPVAGGFRGIAFDDLPNYYTNTGQQVRGYALEAKTVDASAAVECVAELGEFNGSVIYRCDTPQQFNPFTEKAHQITGKTELVGSKQFAVAAKISANDKVRFTVDGKEYVRTFKVDKNLSGTVAFNPSFDSTENYDSYRYQQVQIEKV